MIISVVSGKGGAGKTTIAASLAHILQATYVDLDVDAPDGALFLQPEITDKQTIDQDLPQIDPSLCGACKTCVRECRFNALYMIHGTIHLSESLCHSCGLCALVCSQDAITYRPKPLGTVRSGRSERTGAPVVIGDLRIGSARATSLIQTITDGLDRESLIVIDGPPGNSCAAVEALRPADLAVVVVEPTPFGLHDLQQTLSILEDMGKRKVIIANKAQDDRELREILSRRGLELAASLPLSRDYHRTLLEGEILSRRWPEVRTALCDAIRSEVPSC